jgi:serine/threonine protein phosphatase 1
MLHAFRSEWEAAPRPAPDDTLLLAVGDVHGHLDHLDALLGLLAGEIDVARAAGGRIELVMIGDYIDRGPDSLGVLRRVAALRDEDGGVNVHALLGNHDSYLLDFVLAPEPDPATLEAWCGNGGETTLIELGIEPAKLLGRNLVELACRARAAAGAAVLDLLEHLDLCRQFGAYTFVHAGVHPSRSLAEQGPREFLWLREPFLSARAWPHPFVVVHGHTIRGPEVHPHRIALDSGAYRTGVLTAVQVVGERLRFWCVGSDPGGKAFRRLPGLTQPRRFSALPLTG